MAIKKGVSTPADFFRQEWKCGAWNIAATFWGAGSQSLNLNGKADAGVPASAFSYCEILLRMNKSIQEKLGICLNYKNIW